MASNKTRTRVDTKITRIFHPGCQFNLIRSIDTCMIVTYMCTIRNNSLIPRSSKAFAEDSSSAGESNGDVACGAAVIPHNLLIQRAPHKLSADFFKVYVAVSTTTVWILTWVLSSVNRTIRKSHRSVYNDDPQLAKPRLPSPNNNAVALEAPPARNNVLT